MTWLLVRTRPVESRMTPVPAARALRRPRVLVMLTTLLLTVAAIASAGIGSLGAAVGVASAGVALSASPGVAGAAAPGRAAVAVGRGRGPSERGSNIATSPAT